MTKYYVLKDASLLSKKDLLAHVNAVALIEVLMCNYCLRIASVLLCSGSGIFVFILVHITDNSCSFMGIICALV